MRANREQVKGSRRGDSKEEEKVERGFEKGEDLRISIDMITASNRTQ